MPSNGTRQRPRAGCLRTSGRSRLPDRDPPERPRWDARSRAVDQALESPPERLRARGGDPAGGRADTADDRAGARGRGINAPSADTAPLESGTVAFAWQDAAIGAGAMLVALMLVAVVGLTIRRARVVPS